MIRFVKNRRGLGAPVGNLIILMAAVVLSTTVVMFATNITASQVEKEALYIPESHVWYVNSTSSVAALAITNTGPTDVVLSRLSVKGLTVQWPNVTYTRINGTLSTSLTYTATYNGTAATEALTLQTGQSMIFYVNVPNRIMVYDMATAVRIVLTTTQAVYATDTLVQTAQT